MWSETVDWSVVNCEPRCPIEQNIEQRLRHENEMLTKRHDLASREYLQLSSQASEQQFCDILTSMPDKAIKVTLSYLSIKDLFSMRCVSRRMRNWAEFEMKGRRQVFMVTKKHSCDYEIFLHFKLFPNITTLVIDSLSSSIQLHHLIRLCRDFLPQLKHIVVEGYEEYIVIIGIYPKTEKCVASSPLAKQVLSQISVNHETESASNFTSVYYIHGLNSGNSEQQTVHDTIQYYEKQNILLRDSSELLEKECQRIKNDENFTHFTLIPEELTQKIFGYLGTADYFRLRLVSKELKYYAEMALRCEKQTLYVNLSDDSAYRIYLWSKIYSNIKTLTISGSDISMESFLRLTGNNFQILENLTVCSCDSHNIASLGDYFPGLKSLTLRYNDAIGVGVPDLLRKLCDLQSLTVNGSINTTSDSKLMCFNGNATHLQSFTYECFEYRSVDLKLVSEMLRTELLNLKALHLNLPSTTVFNFYKLFVSNVEELELSCCRIDGNLSFSNEAKSVKKLILSTESNSDVEIGTILKNFTQLNTLQLDLFRNHDITFSPILVETLKSLKSLKFLFLFDAFYAKSKYFTLDDGNKSALIDVLSSLNNVSKFKIEFCQQSYEDEDLLTAVNELIAKKPQQTFELIIPDNEFDLYDSFSEASGEGWDSYVGSSSEFYGSDYEYDLSL